MDARDERIIVFGDSLTHEFADNSPEIWDVDAGSNRVSSSPGSLLASLLLDQGAQAVRTNSRVGRSAMNFFGREATQSLFDSDRAFSPTKVVVMLGTNDIGMPADRTRAAMEQIRDTYKAMGAEVWAIGPMTYVGNGAMLNNQSQEVVDAMQDVFGSRFIDARPLSVNVGRTNDGVHFGADAARMTALSLADALLSQPSPASIWSTAVIVAFGGLAALAIWGWHNKRKHGSLLGAGFGRPALASGDGADPWDTQEDVRRFKALIADDDSEGMEIAQDLALDKDLKLSKISASQLSLDKGAFTLRTDRRDPSVPETRVTWSLAPNTGAGRDAWINEMQVLWNNEWVTFHRKSQRGENIDPWRQYVTETYQGERDWARRAAVSQAWAIAKAIKALPKTASIETVRKAVYAATDKDNSEPGELYGHKPKRKRKKKAQLAGDADNDQPIDRFHRLLRSGEPGAMEAAQDLALEQGWKLADESGAERAPNGTFEMSLPGARNVQWKKAQWNVSWGGKEGRQRIELYIANGSTRIQRDWTIKGDFNKARKIAAANAWAVAKAIHSLPLDTPEADVTRIVDTALNHGTGKRGWATVNVKPKELFGMKTTNIWRKVESSMPGVPYHWELVRDSLPENVDAWIERLKKDEPGVEFRAADKKPPAPRGKKVMKGPGITY